MVNINKVYEWMNKLKKRVEREVEKKGEGVTLKPSRGWPAGSR